MAYYNQNWHYYNQIVIRVYKTKEGQLRPSFYHLLCML